MSVVLLPTFWGSNEPPAVTLFEKAGFDLLDDNREPSASRFEDQLRRLAEESTDCILASAELLRHDMTDGFSLSAVLPRQSARLCLVAALGNLHPTPANVIGLEPGATVAVASPAQQSQLLALWPGLKVVENSQYQSPISALRAHALDAIVVPAHEITISDPEALDVIELGEEVMLPRPGEGTTVIITRASDPLGETLKSLDHPETRRCLAAERTLAGALGRPVGLACLATVAPDGGIRLQATLAGDAPDPRLALARVGAVAATPEAAAELCFFAMEECLPTLVISST